VLEEVGTGLAREPVLGHGGLPFDWQASTRTLGSIPEA
jgi:hypothetical protein